VLLRTQSGSSPPIVRPTAMRPTPSNSPVGLRPTDAAGSQTDAEAPAATTPFTPPLSGAASPPAAAVASAGATGEGARLQPEIQVLGTGEAGGAGEASEVLAIGSPVATLLAKVLQAAKALRSG